MKNIIVENIGKFSLSDNNFIAEGGEAKVYKISNYAAKIYHDMNKSISPKKIDELKTINDPNVLYPLGNIYDSSNSLIGFYMNFIKDGTPLCKYFTKSFKKNNNINFNDIVQIIKTIQQTVTNIHNVNCLVGDMNELNILVDKKKNPVFIDVDSYKTPSFPCTAIAESVRDRAVPFGTFTEETDWFSFAVLIFQLYIGIHPFKGRHPDYKMTEWEKRMNDGVSVFDSRVKLPPVCNSLSDIPKRHQIWLKEVFENNERCAPPQIDNSQPIILKTIITQINGNDKFEIEVLTRCDKLISNVIDVFGSKYFLTKDGVINNGRVVYKNESKSKIHVIGFNGNAYIAKYKYNMLEIIDSQQNVLLKIQADNVLTKDNNVYFVSNDKLYFVEITKLAKKSIAAPVLRTQIYSATAKIFKGVIYQQFSNSHNLYIPFSNSVVKSKIKELDGFRMIECKMKKNTCVIVAEKKNTYSMFILTYDKEFKNYHFRKIDDINYYGINFTTMDNGVTVLFVDTNTIEVFIGGSKIKRIDETPMDVSSVLKSFNNKVFMINDQEFLSLKMK